MTAPPGAVFFSVSALCSSLKRHRVYAKRVCVKMSASEKQQAIVLYYAPDNASLIVRLLMEELELTYETVLVDRSVNAQKSEQYLALNPDGRIPVCIINDAPVFETAAILLTIADMHAGLTVSIEDIRRPQFLKWLFFLSNSLHNDLMQRFYPEKHVDEHPQARQLFAVNSLSRMNRRFAIFDEAFSDSETTYLFGREPTIVDLYLAVCFRWAQLYPLDGNMDFAADQFPAILNMVGTLELRSAIRRGCEKEGVTGLFFSHPEYANPTEGVAL